MVAETATKLLTADDLLRLDSQGRYGELIRGEFCERPPSGMRHGATVATMGYVLYAFGKPRGLDRFAIGTGIWLERDPDTVREVDVTFWSGERRPLGEVVDGYSEVVPDLAVEVEDQWDRRNALHDKALMWLSHGVRLVWVVHPDAGAVDVYREEGPIVTLTGDATLDGGDVLPGFTCELRAIFER